MKKFHLLLSCILGLLVLCFPRPACAAGEFGIAYDVSYAVAPAGTTIVTQQVTLTNKTTNLYPQQYSLTLDSTAIKNVIAYDGGGVISPAVSQEEGKTRVLLAFNEQVVGLGKSLSFTLRYEHNDIARKNGTIWEVTIPGIVPDPGLERYDTTLNVPPSFGPNAYLTPQPANGRSWNKEQMIAGGISGAWGEAQQFDLTLRYHLNNPSSAPVTQAITLPPDTAYQKVAVRSINPQPADVLRDPDGNWIARYTLAAGQSIDIEASARVQTFLIRQDAAAPLINIADYTTPQKYWESDNPQIKEIAATLTTPREIYEYVVRTLSYDYERVNQNPTRQGALAALADPTSAICMEFTDLFIALARAAGIPAREVIGYAYTTNAKLRPLSLVSDVLHAWPEYYDTTRGIWIPVDPTWADTTGGVNYFDKLDFNHIAFAIHGISSEAPFPAGFFRKSGATGKDVEVSFAQAAADEVPPKFSVDFHLPGSITAGFPTRGQAVIKNTSGVAVSHAAITIRGEPYNLTESYEDKYFPPLGTYEIPLSLAPLHPFTRGAARFTLMVNGDVFEHTVPVRPLYWLLLPLVGAAAVILGIWKIRRHKI